MLKNVRILINSPSSRRILVNNNTSQCLNDRPGLAAMMGSLRLASSNAAVTSDEKLVSQPKEKISKAMKAYLERAKAHEEFMEKQKTEFQIGRRHLANIMGVDADTMTQGDIDKAIQYLFPSGLFEPRARPMMKPPEEIFPVRKAAEFDVTGRPHHSLFYTMNPNFYQLLNNAVSHMEELNKEEDKLIKQRGYCAPAQLDVSGSEWVSKQLLEKALVEKLNDSQYTQFEAVMVRFLEHPLSSKCSDFVMKYRNHLISQTQEIVIPKPSYDSDGRAFITVKESQRKTSVADVTVRMPGTGLFSINGKDVLYFSNIQDREQLLFPLIFTGLVDRVDVEATASGGGPSGQSGAIRYGISVALQSFVDSDMVEKMRLAGLLQRDRRLKERKKPGQPRARKKPTWKKR